MARNIRNDIAAGVLRDGQPLPGTRELAEQWGVSVFTISEAMKLLAKECLVVSKPRAGRVVHAPDQVPRDEVRPSTPYVVLIGGYAGSGKTELGRILARETGWPLLDKGTLTRPVVEVALGVLGCSPHDRESATYLDVIRPREYEALISAMTENVRCGTSAIVTAPFVRELRDTAWINRITATCHDNCRRRYTLMPAVVLYGPLAAGKDTVTEALTRLDESYQLYQRLKVGAGRTAGYRMTTLSHVDALRSAGSVLWETRRYDALYVVDRTSLTDMLEVCINAVKLGRALG